MAKTTAGPLMQDSLGTYFDALVDPATGTTYAKRAINLHTSANGDYADPTAVLYDALGNPLVSTVSNVGSGFQINAATPQAAFQPLVYDSTNFKVITSARQAADGADGSFAPTSAPILFNGVTYDRQYNSHQQVLLASAARTASANSPQVRNYNHRGGILTLRITASSLTGGLTLKIAPADPVDGSAPVAVWTDPSAPRTAAVSYTFLFYPGAATGGGSAYTSIASIPLPDLFTVTVTAGDASSYTYQLGIDWLV